MLTSENHLCVFIINRRRIRWNTLVLYFTDWFYIMIPWVDTRLFVCGKYF